MNQSTRFVRPNSTYEITKSVVSAQPHRYSVVCPVGHVDVRLGIQTQSITRPDLVKRRPGATTTSDGETQWLTLDPLHDPKVAIVQNVHRAIDIESDGGGRVEFAQTTSTGCRVASKDEATATTAGSGSEAHDATAARIDDVVVLIAIDDDVARVGETVSCGTVTAGDAGDSVES